MHANGSERIFDVAIIGGGIVGVILALGLVKRDISVTIYEQSKAFREIGAGVSFTANAIKAMSILDDEIVGALKRVTTMDDGTDYLQFVDGYNHKSDPNDTNEKHLFSLYTGKGFVGCHRAHFMDQIVKLLPEGGVVFGKRLDSWIDKGDDSKVLMKFTDGTTAEADAGKFIGCDGIKSRVRQLLLDEDNPASYPHYSHKYAYRAVIPMGKAVAALGYDNAHSQHMHMGPEAHIVNLPVANQTLVNVVAYVTDSEDWSSESKLTAPATRDEVVKSFAKWGPVVRAITHLLPDELDKWAIFDTYDYPASTYVRGRVCIAGDAAHAAAPHHGGGAGIGVEDALALVSLLERVMITLQTTSVAKSQALTAAFAAYDPVRRERTQWFVRSSRGICETYEWNDPKCGSDLEKCLAEIRWRSHKLWHFDLDYMVGEVVEGYKRLLA